MIHTALRLQFKLNHSAGELALPEAEPLLAEALRECPIASLVDAYKAIVAEPNSEARSGLWDLERPFRKALEAFGGDADGVAAPRLIHSTPTGRTNWNLTGPDPVIWIERSKPGAAGLGLPGERVITYHVRTREIEISPQAEARHLHTMADLLVGQVPYPAWATGPDGTDVAVTRSGFDGINDELAEQLRQLAARAVRLDEIACARRDLLRIDPLRHPAEFDKALATLAAIEAAE